MSETVCGMPSFSFTCQLLAGHEGQHEYDDGITRTIWLTPDAGLVRPGEEPTT
jgi:hypothetical protein